MGKPITRSLSRSLQESSCTSGSQSQSQTSATNASLTKIPFRPRKIRKLSIHTSTANNTEASSAGKLLSAKGEIDLALEHLRNSEPLLAALINTHKHPIFESNTPPFLSLSRSILYQQLALNAAKSIYTRFLTLCGGESGVLPENVLSLSVQQLREIGISGRKASYLHDLADKYRNGSLSDSSILEMSDDMLLTSLTAVKGIGVWSVHMFMIFSLHRPDVLPVGDLGVRKGVQSLYGLKELPQPSLMEQLCEKWRPYRSVGSWYMWRLMEAKTLAKATAKS
ncbi:alkylbase DNA glycosidase-like protein mag2 [Ricinus communis]|uniref:DNA-3-methyladenine glycosylase, putative n=1 Tax=Ricinus communis TaxID=3988 RepID=B9S6F5_RICCO|nr:alkylbase DNA glycosidase-like protein mag2 [Ricinus communis]EEF40845.1 DNA-3-methyladenine glycosylase, putative [Ricinus communis]|eukprot:XP_002521574.1 probable DNA-3-methyladenine glycosylase 2 [Ricinus communis]